MPDLRVDLGLSTSSSYFEPGTYFVLDTDVLDGSATLPGGVDEFIDISQDIEWVTIRRGKQRDLDTYSAGTCSIGLHNATRRFDPTNTSSDLYGNIEPMRPLRVTAIVAGEDHPLFTGYAENWSVDYSDSLLARAQVEGVDTLAVLARMELDQIAAAFSGDLPGARIDRVLALPEVDYQGATDLDDGTTVLGPTTFGGNVAQYLQTVAQSDAGDLFAAADGTLTFEQSGAIGGKPLAATFSDDADLVSTLRLTDGGELSLTDGSGLLLVSQPSSPIEYARIDQNFSADLLYNRVTVTGTSGTPQTAEDTASQTAYGIRSLALTMLMLADSDAADLASWLLFRYSTPEMRLRQVEVEVEQLSAAQQLRVCGLDLTDRTYVERTPPGGGSPSTISQYGYVTGMEWKINANPGNWRATVTMAAGSNSLALLLDDIEFGQLDDDVLGV